MANKRLRKMSNTARVSLWLSSVLGFIMAALLFIHGVYIAFSAVPYDGGTGDGWETASSDTLQPAGFSLGGATIGTTISSSSNQVFNLGQTATTISPITITEGAAPVITAANDIRIRIPGGFPMSWDASITTAGITGSASSKASPAVTYEGSSKVLIIDVTSNFAAGDSITISGLKFTNFTGLSAGWDTLGLDINNDGGLDAPDDKKIIISDQYGRGTGDGWAFAESAMVSLGPPAAPTACLISPTSTTGANITWTDNSDGETGFIVERSIDGTSYSWSTTVSANTTPAPSATTYLATSLTINTKYWYQVAAYALGTSSYSTASPKYTLIEPATGVTWSTVTQTAITLTSVPATFTNIATPSSGIFFTVTGDAVGSGWTTSTTWTKSGLTANTPYTFYIQTRNADGVTSATYTAAAKYTLAVAPNVSANPAASSSNWYSAGQTWTFTNTAGFGAGGVEYYRYAWDTTATHTWAETETQWTTATLTQTPSTSGIYYLHLKSYNAENAASGTADLGPFQFDTVAPTITNFILKGNVSDSDVYVNNTQDAQVVKAVGIFNDDVAANSLKAQFSEDNTNWGTYTGAANQTDTGWTYYKTVTASATSQPITDAWKLSGDGTKTLYARVKDGAGNIAYGSFAIPSLSNDGGGAWQYRRPITIAGSTAWTQAQTNYQVAVDPGIYNNTGLVASWHFSEGTGTTTTDLSGNNNTGTITNATWTTGGKFGNALRFDGTGDYVSVPDSPLLSLNNKNVTIEAWVNLQSKKDGGIVAKWTSNVDVEYELEYSLSSDRFVWKVTNTSDVWDASVTANNFGPPNTGTWYFIVAYYNGSNIGISVNNGPFNTTTYSGGIRDGGGNLYIGYDSPAASESPNGLIDEVKIYNRVLSEDEIRQHYNNGTPKVRHDYQDIRFTNAAGTELPYWQETDSKFWVNTGTTGIDKADLGATLYMYYGNASATFGGANANNGTNTFEFFDDFSGDLSKWNPNRGSPSITAGELTLVDAATLVSKTAHAYPKILETRSKFISDVADIGMVGNTLSATDLHVDTNQISVYSQSAAGYQASKDGTTFSEVSIGNVWDFGNYHIWKEVWTGTAFDFYKDGALVNNKVTNIPIVNLYAGFSSYRAAPQSKIMSDWIFVRKYVSPEPMVFVGQKEDAIGWTIGGTNFKRQKPITISGSTTWTAAQTNYQVAVDPQIYNNTGLVGSWHMEEASGTAVADNSGYVNNGTATGTTVVTGKFGNARQFNGTSDYVSVPDSANWDFGTGNFTIDVWAYSSTWANAKAIINNRHPTNANDQEWALEIWDNGIEFHSGTVEYLNSGVMPSNNIWHHIVVVREGTGAGQTKLYLDGSQIATATMASNFNAGYDLEIGTEDASYSGGIGKFNGLIDEVKIYNRALSADEIRQRYNNGTPKVRHDYQDIRFTDSSGNERAYWQETDSKFWVNAPSIDKADNGSTLYMYYGNPSATFGGANANNGTNTFDFFDDFSGDLSKWTDDGNLVDSQNNGYLVLDDGTVAGNFYSSTNFSLPKAIRMKGKLNSPGGTYVIGGAGFTSGDMPTGGEGSTNFVSLRGHSGISGNYLLTTKVGAGITSVSSSIAYNTEHIFDVLWKSGEGKLFIDGGNELISITNIPSANLYAGFFMDTNDALHQEWDWVLVRKYASPETLSWPGEDSGKTGDGISLETTAPSIAAAAITAPASTAVWDGTLNTHNITWSTGAITDANLASAPVSLYYSTDGGSGWTAISGASALANSGSFTWTTLSGLSISSNTCKIKIRATDTPGNYAEQATAWTFIVDSSAPSAPGQPADAGLYWTTSNSLTWTWSASTDTDSGIQNYYLVIDTDTTAGGEVVNDLDVGNVTSYTWTSAVDGNTYCARVKARNNAGLIGSYSAYSDILVDLAAPPAVNTLSGPVATNIDVALTWSAVSDGESGIDFYRIYRAGAPIGTTTNTYYSDPASGLSSGTTYTYEVRPVDLAGNQQDSGNNQIAVLYDNTEPTVASFTLQSQVRNDNNYVNTVDDNQIVKALAKWGDNVAGGTLQIQFSESGTAGTWGKYDVSWSTMANRLDSGDTWAANTYWTISADSANIQTIANAWRLSSVDAAKTLRVRVKDAAGNIVFETTVVNSLTNAGGGAWQYQKPITIAGSTTWTQAQTNYQVAVDPQIYNNTGLVGSWHFSEGGSATTTADMSGNNNTGTWAGAGAHWTTSGKFGNGGVFNGTDDYVNVSTFTIPTDITFEAWIKGESFTPPWGRDIVGVSDGTSTNSYHMHISIVDVNTRYIALTEYVGAGNYRLWRGGTNLNTGTFYHVAVTQSGVGNTPALYLNGVPEIVTLADSGGTISGRNSQPLRIGTMTPTQWNFNGSIDEVKIYNRALSADEISQHYNNGTPKVRHDYQDIRFTNAAGTELPYWQETDSKFWVKADSIPNTAEGTTINMYYGNASATFGGVNANNGANTFIQYHGASASNFVDESIVTIPFVYEVRGRLTVGGQLYFGTSNILNSAMGASDSLSLDPSGSGGFNLIARDNGGETFITGTPGWVIGDYYNTKIVAVSSSLVDYYIHNTTTKTGSLTTGIPNAAMGLNFYKYSGDGDQEYSFVRKYASPEPIVFAGQEEGSYTVNGVSGFTRKKPITIAGSTTWTQAQTNYQVAIDPGIYNNTGLVGSWHFSEGAGTSVADMSGNNNSGTWNGDLANDWTTVADKPFLGKAGVFNGSSDYVNTNNYINNFNGDFTISVWVKTASAAMTTIFSKGYDIAGYGPYILIRSQASGTTSQFYLLSNSPSNNAAGVNGISINDGNWHFITGVRNGSNMSYYIDGVSQGSASIPATENYNSNYNVLIGAKNGNGPIGEFFNGSIDEVKIYNRALSEDEIRQRYNNGTPKVRHDYQDIRFTNASGTELPYWQETDSKFWVNTGSNGILAADLGATLYMYYGNPSAAFGGANANNGANTFVYFQNFDEQSNGAQPTNWNDDPGGKGNAAVSNAVSFSGLNSMSMTGDKAGAWYAGTNDIFNLNAYRIGAKLYPAQSDGALGFYSYSHTALIQMGGALTGLGSGTWGYNDGIWRSLGAYTANSWHRIEEVFDGDKASIYKNGILQVFNVDMANTASTKLRVHGESDASNGMGLGGYIDDIYVCKYISPDALAFVEQGQAAMSISSSAISLDTTAPSNPTGLSTTPATTNTPTGYSNVTNPTLNWSANGSDTSGVQKYQIRVNSGSWSDFTAGSNVPAGIVEGTNTIDIRTWDNAGNVSTPTSISYYCDLTAPTVSGFILNAQTRNDPNYVNAADDNKLVKATGTFGDNIANTTLKVQFSDDAGSNWGAYSGAANVIDNTWANVNSYKTVTLTGTSTAWTIDSAWQLSTPDSAKSVYIRLKDAAGNIITRVPTLSGSGAWQYRKPIAISGSTAWTQAQADYQVSVDPAIYDNSGLVGSWHFNGPTSGNITDNTISGFEDMSGSGNNGTAKNAIGTGMAWTAGYNGVGSGVNFDAVDDYVDCGNASSLVMGTSDFTLEAWVKVMGPGPDTNTAMIIDKGGSGAGDYQYSLYYQSAFDRFGYYIESAEGVISRLSTGNIGAAGNWKHLVVTKTGNGTGNVTTRLYINGVNNTGAELTGATLGSIGSTGKLIIGSQSKDVTGRLFNGLVDEVKIYNRALSEPEIQQRYNNGAPKVRHDYQDIRFTNAAGTELSYWQGTDSKFWVKVDNIPNTLAGTTIYEYYGNSSAASVSNFNNVFAKDYGNESGLVGLWHMDDGGTSQTVTDSSGQGNNGTRGSTSGADANDPTWQASDGPIWQGTSDGRFSTGSALQFDDVNDYVDAGNASSLNITGNQITLSVWIKPGDQTEHAGIIWKEPQTYNPVYGLMIYSSEDIDFALKNSTGGTVHPMSNALTINVWHYIVGTYNGTTAELYIDGVLNDSKAFTGNLMGVNTNLLIGTRDSDIQYFNGTIDEVRIYNRALSAPEIYRQYVRSKYVSPEPSVGAARSEEIPTTPYSITLDTTVPANPALLYTAPATTSASYSNNTTPALNWTTDATDTNGIKRYELKINTGTWAAFTKGANVPAGIDKQRTQNTLYLRAVDNADNISVDAPWPNIAYYCRDLVLVSPDGGETWTAGAASTIQWKKAQEFSEGVDILYSADGANWTPDNSNCWTIASGVSGTSYVWTPAASYMSAGTAKIRVQGASTPSLQDTSAAAFTLQGFKLTRPNTALEWTVANSEAINWTSVGTVTNVTLSYSTNDTTWTIMESDEEDGFGGLASGLGNTGSWASWLIPNNVSDAVKAKITGTIGGATSSDASDVTFKIKPGPSLTITSPDQIDGGESWIMGTAQNITWTSNYATAQTVKIEHNQGTANVLSNAGGGTWQYKKPITIAGSTTWTQAQTNYQVSVDPGIYNNTGLVGSWHFSEGGTATTTADMSGNNNNGTMNGTSYWTTGGKFGNGFSGSGDDYVDAGSGASLDFSSSTPLAFSAWVYNNLTIPTSLDFRQILARYPGTNAGYGLSYGYYAVYGGYVVWTGFFGGKAGYINYQVPSGQWTHIAATYNGSNWIIFINGVSQTTTQEGVGSTATSSPLIIGKLGSVSDRFHNGTIDEVKIYNRALSADEIAQHYNNGTPKVRHDYQDIRFTNSSGTELPYWQETDSKFWVKADNIPNTTAGATINAYYGNSSATFATDCATNVNAKANCGANTFVFFDDFSGDLSKWNVLGSPAIVSGQLLKITGSNVWASNGVYSTQTISAPFILEWSEKSDITNMESFSGWMKSNNHTDGGLALYKALADSKRYLYDGRGSGSGMFGSGVAQNTNTESYRLTVRAGNSAKVEVIGGSLIVDSTDTGSGTTNSNYSIGFNVYSSSNNYEDDVRVRKYATPEPTVFAEQEEGTYNVGGTNFSRKKAINISGSTTWTQAQTNYQVSVDPAIYNNTGLVGSWHFNGPTSGNITDNTTSGFEDMSGSGNNGTAKNAIGTGMSWTTGYKDIGSGVYFDGVDDYVEVPNHTSLKPTGPMTVEAWVKVTTNAERSFVFKGSGWEYGVSWYITEISTGQFNFVRNYGNGSNAQAKTATSGAGNLIGDGQWHHVAGVDDGVNLMVYIDGVQKGTPVVVQGLIPYTNENNPLTFFRMGTRNYWYDGSIDEVKIYNRALSADEIRQQYNNGSPQVRHDYQDIRFTKSDGITELPYWQETDSKFWVNVDNIPNTAAGATINMYYGNASANFGGTYANNGANTFEFFDDFQDGDYVGWTTGSAATLTVETDNTKYLKGAIPLGTSVFKTLAYAGASNSAFVYEGRVSFGGSDYSGITFRHSADNTYYVLWSQNGSSTFGLTKLSGGARTDYAVNTGYAYNLNNFYPFKLAIDASGNIAFTFNGVTTAWVQNDLPAGGIGFAAFNNAAHTGKLDDVRVRKYASPEPMVTNLEIVTQGTTWTPIKENYMTVDDGIVPNNRPTSVGDWTTNSYAWTIPDLLSEVSDAKVKITDTVTAAANTTSGNFSIVRPTITIASPNGNEGWKAGESRAITWTTVGSKGATVDIYYALNGNEASPAWSLIGDNPSNTNMAGDYISWTWANIPQTAVSANSKIRIVDNTYNTGGGYSFTVADESNNTFAVSLPGITVGAINTPESNGDYVAGEVYTINWTSEAPAGSSVTIQLSTNGLTGPFNTILWTVANAAGANSTTWTIAPGTNAAQARLKIIDNDRDLVSDVSDADFTIIPIARYALNSPVNNDNLAAGRVFWTSAVNGVSGITWSGIGNSARSATFVNIYYSKDGVNWTADNSNCWTISSSTDNDGLFESFAPGFNQLSNNGKIKIVSTADSNVNGTSSPFNVLGKLTVNTPASAGIVWTLGAGNTISWSTEGKITAVNIYYSKNGVNWTADGSTCWTIGSSVSNADPADTGDPDPAGTYINYLKNTNWTIANLDTYLSASGKIKIVGSSPAASSVVSGVSWTFSVVEPTISVSLPAIVDTDANGKKEWVQGDTQSITWTFIGALTGGGNVELAYTTNGSTWTVISNTIADNATSYNWAPAFTSSSIKLRVKDLNANRPNSVGISEEFESVPAPVINITAPSAVVSWRVGTANAITWSSSVGVSNNVVMKYATAESGYTWTTITSGQSADGSFSWTVPQEALSSAGANTNAKIEISDGNRPATVPALFTNLTILPPAFTISSPSAASKWVVGQAINQISWSTSGEAAAVDIYYDEDQGAGVSWSLIGDNIANTSNGSTSYAWTIPDDPGSTNIKIEDTSRPATTPSTSANFEISRISLDNYPGKAASESYTVNTTTNITWTPTGIPNLPTVNLQYFDGANWYDMEHTTLGGVTAVANSAGASYLWTVRDTITASAKVRVLDADNSAVVHIGVNNFKIIGAVDLTAPNGGETDWIVGTVKNITWTATAGTFTNVKLEYSTDAGSSWTIVQDNQGPADGIVSNSGSYAWTIPDIANNNAKPSKVRVSEASGLSNTDSSASTFIMRSPIITVQQPGSGQNGFGSLTINEPYDIKWTTQGVAVNSVKIEVSYDNQFSWTTVAENQGITNDGIVANSGLFSWAPLETTLESQGWIRVTEVSPVHDISSGRSDLGFTVLTTPSLTVTAPSGSNWIMGNKYTIQWTYAGLVFNNLRLSYTLDGSIGSPVWTDIASGKSNSGSYSWTLPDLVTTLSNQPNAQIKITDDTKGTIDDSPYFTLAIPTVGVGRPVGGEVWAAGDVAPINWTYSGAIIGPLTLQYDASGTVSDSSAIITSTAPKTGEVGGTYTYNWTVPSGVYTSTFKVRVKDSPRPNSKGDSPVNFTVIASPAIAATSPANGSVYVVEDGIPINWTIRGLSIDNVKIEYWNDNNPANDIVDGTETLQTIVTGVSRGSSDTADAYSGKYSGSFTWTVPAEVTASQTLKLKLTGFNGAAEVASAFSSGHFRIRGGFEFRDETNTNQILANTTDWKAKTTHNIKWYNRGTFPTVKLEYRTAATEAGLTGAAWTTAASSFANSPVSGISTYPWTVPDPHLDLYPAAPPENYYVQLKISDTTDDTIYAESNPFKISYYTVTWKLKDYDTLTFLTNLTVRSTGGGITYWNIGNDGLTFDAGYNYFTRRFPYCTVSTIWSKSGYIDRSDNDHAISDNIEITMLLESSISATQEYKVYAGVAYNEDTDILKANTWLEKKGTLITGADADLGVGGSAYVKIYDGDTLVTTLPAATPDSNGNYWFSVSKATAAIADGGLGLISGKTYFAKIGIWYRSREYQSGTSFDITISKKLKEMTQLITDTTAAIQNTTTAISLQTQAIKEAVRGEAEAVTETLTTRIGKVLTAAETTLPNAIEAARSTIVTEITEEIEPKIESGILNRDTVVKQGDTVTLRYRTATGLSPTISVYDPNNVQRVSAVQMKEIGATGIYEYDLKFDQGWGKGDYTILTSESTKGTLDALIMTAQTASLEEVSGQVSAILGTTAGLGDISQAASTLDSQLATIVTAIESISKGAGAAVEEIAGKNLEPIISALKKVAADMKSLGGVEGYNLDDLYDISDKQTNDIKYLSNKTTELRKLLELMKELMDKKFEEPVIKTWYESGSVILRALLVNPSKTLTRTVPFKYYLPKEVKIKDIMDKGDLELTYDTQQGLYYVYKDIELKPGESKRVYVEIEDIWVIDEKQIADLKEQVEKYFVALKDSGYAERGDYLMKKIEKDLQQVSERQAAAGVVNPEEHISMYRENIKVLDMVKEDVLEMERLAGRITHISPLTTWRMIIMIVIFLAVVSLLSFVVWQTKLKEVSPPVSEGPKEKEAQGGIEAESRESKEEKKVDIEDIKKRLEE